MKVKDPSTKPKPQQLGGQARAEALSPGERSEIARKAAGARWHSDLPKATHEGPLRIAGIEIPCAVLEDGTRVLSRIGFIRAIGRRGKAKGGRKYDMESQLPVFLTAENIKPFIPKELLENSKPIQFRPKTGGPAMGYRADLLPLVCNVFLDAKEAGTLRPNQVHIAEQCKILNRGFSVVGLTALIDEATGYQEVRDRLALQAILDKYITDEWAKWTKTFSDDFYREMFRLRGLDYPVPRKGQKPQYIGHLTNDVIYDRLAPGVLNALRDQNPRTESGTRKRKHHQHLTADLGHPVLTEHLAKVTFLMKAFSDWKEFKKKLDLASPKYGDTIPLGLDD